MQVLCPSCETEYEIPALQRPRKLRCARCASEWRVMPSPDVALAVAGDVPESDAPQLDAPVLEEGMVTGGQTVADVLPTLPATSLAVPRAGQMLAGTAPGRRSIDRTDLLIGLLWLASLIVIAAGLWALWHWRGPIGHRWPPSLRLYRLLPHGSARTGGAG